MQIHVRRSIHGDRPMTILELPLIVRFRSCHEYI